MRIFERCEAWNSISSKKLFLQNAVNALNFEKNQIQNFFKQKARLEVNTFFLYVNNQIPFQFIRISSIAAIIKTQLINKSSESKQSDWKQEREKRRIWRCCQIHADGT